MNKDDTFMLNGKEFRIIKLKKNYVCVAKQIDDIGSDFPILDSVILIGNKYFKVTYANKGKKFINIKEL